MPLTVIYLGDLHMLSKGQWNLKDKTLQKGSFEVCTLLSKLFIAPKPSNNDKPVITMYAIVQLSL